MLLQPVAEGADGQQDNDGSESVRTADMDAAEDKLDEEIAKLVGADGVQSDITVPTSAHDDAKTKTRNDDGRQKGKDHSDMASSDIRMEVTDATDLDPKSTAAPKSSTPLSSTNESLDQFLQQAVSEFEDAKK